MDFFDKNFDPEKTRKDLVDWIRSFFQANGPGCKGIIAISGGKDSTVTAALLTEALGRDRVFGVLLPNGEQKDIEDSKLVTKILDIDYAVINIKDAFDGIIHEMKANLPVPIGEDTIINLPARLRMASVYAVGQSMNGRVANTCNLSEDWVGYATRYGDGAGDFSPLSHLTVQEVRGIGKVMNLPDELIFKTPVDGLTPLTDEEKLGFTYDTLDRYIRTGEIDDPKTKESIDRKHQANLFKLRLMPAFPHNGPVLASE
ncbi:MAG: NAD(+) synthase [Eubacteriales bacterium]|nr:NAD(+) synthase [Eubacteriales bacterium]